MPPCRSYRQLITLSEFDKYFDEFDSAESKKELAASKKNLSAFKRAQNDLMVQADLAHTALVKGAKPAIKQREAEQDAVLTN